MSDFLPPGPPSSPSPPNAPPPSGGAGSFGGPPGGGFGGPPDGFGGPPGGGFGDGGMQAPPPKSSSSTKGCLIALAVVFGIVALCTCTGVGLVGYGIYSNPEARRAFGAMGDIFSLMQEGMADPGAQALVQAGCQQAVAFRLDRLMEIMRTVDPDDAPADPGPDAPEWVVTCSLRDTDRSCDELARTFIGAHGDAPRSFALTVQSWPGSQQVCANLYGPAGELIRPLSEAEQYDVPTAPPPGAPAPMPPSAPPK